MKNYLLGLAIIATITTSCKKVNHKPGEVNPDSKKYGCFCTTTISFVDFCRVDTVKNTNEVNAYSNEEAEKLCKQQNSSESSTYTLAVKSCEIK